MADAEVLRMVDLTREQARALRRAAKDAVVRAEALIRRAIVICGRYKQLERIEAVRADALSETTPQVRQRFHARTLEVIEQLKRSLSDLETIRMIPSDDAELRALKEDIRQTIERADPAKGTERQMHLQICA